MNRTTVALLMGVFLLSACGENEQKDKKTEPAGITLENAMAGAPKGAKADVIRMQKVSGEWRSMSAILPNREQHLLLTISNDNRFVLEVRSRSPDDTMDSVNVQVRGPISWTPEGYLSGTGKGAKDPIPGFSSWTARFSGAQSMIIKGSDGKEFTLSYKGL